MTVRELIEALEELPQDYKVVIESSEVTEIVTRNEIYYSEEGLYKEDYIVKLY